MCYYSPNATDLFFWICFSNFIFVSVIPTLLRKGDHTHTGLKETEKWDLTLMEYQWLAIMAKNLYPSEILR